MKNIKLSIIAILLLASASLFTSCYTVLIHSHQQTRNEQPDEVLAVEEETCTLCGGEHPTIYHYSGMMQDPSFGIHSRWYDYYESYMPWWVPANTIEDEADEAENDETNYTGRNYGRRRAALEEKSGGAIGGGGAVQTGSGGYNGSSSGGGNYSGTGAVIANPPAQADTSGSQNDQDSISTHQSSTGNNTQRDYGGRTVRKKK